MKLIRHSISILAVLLLFGSGTLYAQAMPLTVISNQKGSPLQMKQSELKSIFLGERQRWRNGNKIVIALMKTNTPAGKNVCERIYAMNGDEVKKLWLALVFQGKTEAPVFFNSASELEAFVSENPGTIGITDQPPTASPVRVVLIDGKRSF